MNFSDKEVKWSGNTSRYGILANKNYPMSFISKIYAKNIITEFLPKNLFKVIPPKINYLMHSGT